MASVTPPQLAELAAMLIALALLLALANYLSFIGLFDPITTSHASLPPLLIATAPHPTNRPELTSATYAIARLVAARGLHEDPPSILSDDLLPTSHQSRSNPLPIPSPARAHLIAILSSVWGSSSTPSTGRHGVVLDAGHRATSTARSAWARRLAAHSLDVSLHPGAPAIRAAMPLRTGFLSMTVARWRLLRRLERRARGELRNHQHTALVDCVIIASPKSGWLSAAATLC